MSHSIAFGYSMKCSYTSLSFNALWHCLQVLQLFSPFCTRTYVHASRHVNHHYVKTFAWSIVKGGHKPPWPPKWNPAHHRACAVSCIAASCHSCFHFSLHKLLKDEVYSPAGTSIQAIQVLEKAGLRGLFMETVQTACKRAAELSRIENGETQDYALKRRWTMYKSRTSTSFMIITPTHSSYILCQLFEQVCEITNGLIQSAQLVNN